MELKVEIKIDVNSDETKVVIITSHVDEEILKLADKITSSDKNSKNLLGYNKNLVEIISEDKIFRIFASEQKVYLETERGTFLSKNRLYELEEILNKENFVRISNSEIINLRKVINFDLSFSGTICVNLENKKTTYVSRRYVGKIKEVLGI